MITNEELIIRTFKFGTCHHILSRLRLVIVPQRGKVGLKGYRPADRIATVVNFGGLERADFRRLRKHTMWKSRDNF